jgi:hypothetical protein
MDNRVLHCKKRVAFRRMVNEYLKKLYVPVMTIQKGWVAEK